VNETRAAFTSADRWHTDDELRADRPGIVASLLRYRLIVVATILLAAVAGYSIELRQPVRYEATAGLIMSDPGDSSVLGSAGSPLSSGDRPVYLAKQSAIMASSVVLERAQLLLKSQQSLDDLRRDVTVAPTKDLAGISIGAVGSDAGSSAALANAVGTAYQQVSTERTAQDAQSAIASMEKIKARLQDELDASPKSPDGTPTTRQGQLSGQITNLQQREQDVATQASVDPSGVELFERAEAPTSPTQPKPKLYAVLGAVLGLLIAGAWAWWAAARKRRAEGRADPARILGAPLLGEVPQLKTRPLSASPQRLAPGVADAYHWVVASLGHEMAIAGGASVVVSSVTPDNNTTSITLQIASAALSDDRKILLIDADARTRRLSELCGALGTAPGEGNAHDPLPLHADELNAGKDYARRLVLTRSGVVLAATPNGNGADHPSTSMGAAQVRQALRSVGTLFDLVLIDAPPLLAASDAISVAAQADGVVLVVNHRVLLSRLREVRERLSFVNTPLIGYVYVRPTPAGVRTLWGRAGRRPGHAGMPEIVTHPDPLNVPEAGSDPDRIGPPPRGASQRWRHPTAGSSPSRASARYPSRFRRDA
jgi:capsular polysaccharide biosynthesis protein